MASLTDSVSLNQCAELWNAMNLESGQPVKPEGEGRSRAKPLRDAACRDQPTSILIVEDNKSDEFLIRESIFAAGIVAEIHVVNDGEKALQYFREVDQNDDLPCPSLVVLDINLPKRHGTEVLQEMRKSRRCGGARVVVATSSDSVKDRQDVALYGLDEYFRKPSDYNEFIKLGSVIKHLLE